jgi:hypothetical protein
MKIGKSDANRLQMVSRSVAEEQVIARRPGKQPMLL